MGMKMISNDLTYKGYEIIYDLQMEYWIIKQDGVEFPPKFVGLICVKEWIDGREG